MQSIKHLAIAILLAPFIHCCFGGSDSHSGLRDTDAESARVFGQYTANSDTSCAFQTQSLVAQQWCVNDGAETLRGMLASGKPGTPLKQKVIVGDLGSSPQECWNVSVTSTDGITALYLPVSQWTVGGKPGGSSTPPVSGGGSSPTPEGGGPTPDRGGGPSTVGGGEGNSTAIAQAKSSGWIVGPAGFSFQASTGATRELAVSIGIQAYAKKTNKAVAKASTAPFGDVPVDNWAAGHIALAKSLNAIVGYSSTKFGLGATMSRGELMQFLDRLAQKTTAELHKTSYPPKTNAGGFSDISGKYYENAVKNLDAFCKVARFGAGGSDTAFGGDEGVTEGEAVTAIVTLMNCFQ